MSEIKKNENHRYVAKIKNQEFVNKSTGEAFSKLKVVVDNPYPTNKDGEANPFHKGNLLWFDAEKGKYYKVKSLDVTNVSEKSKQVGFTHSLRLDLGDAYAVEELDS